LQTADQSALSKFGCAHQSQTATFVPTFSSSKMYLFHVMLGLAIIIVGDSSPSMSPAFLFN
jgi:hypothetical protein